MTVKKIHVMTLPPDLDLALLGGLLGGVEATLFRLGAHQGWVDPDQRPALAIMAEMPDRVHARPRGLDQMAGSPC
jgi:hypothetical protein